ncbi:retrotransposon protein, putative, Ty3-gypsy subclass [Panicum miliaceum]|uniref:Retrotransposon protein, putative, Ty3-gypsy subclass n=1 Tax=Panicum miliaceum TaxID=4540 RepID=A0A3L6RVS8_PANMI|nr:retrotransposon protein, putative, Ty3-gypsy subclass [Panicum miliaceum]
MTTMRSTSRTSAPTFATSTSDPSSTIDTANARRPSGSAAASTMRSMAHLVLTGEVGLTTTTTVTVHTDPPVGIKKFDGDYDPKTWLRTYNIATRAASGNNDIMAAYFPVMMSCQALNWLEGLRSSSIHSWQDLCTAFVNHFQASCPGPKTRWDLGSVTQQPNENLRDYTKRYFTNRNMITDVDDRGVIHYFHQGMHNIKLWCKMFESNPKIISEMMIVISKHANIEDAEKAHRHHKNRRYPVDRPKQRLDNRQRPDGRPPHHNFGKHNDRPESYKEQERNRGPDNTVAVADRP